MYASKSDGMSEIHTLLERHKLQRESVRSRNLNRLITSKEIALAILKLSTKENLGLDGFTSEFNHAYRNTNSSHTLTKNLKRKKHFPTHSMTPVLH